MANQSKLGDGSRAHRFVGRLSAAQIRSLGLDPHRVCSVCTETLGSRAKRVGAYKAHAKCVLATRALEHMHKSKAEVEIINLNSFLNCLSF